MHSSDIMRSPSAGSGTTKLGLLHAHSITVSAIGAEGVELLGVLMWLAGDLSSSFPCVCFPQTGGPLLLRGVQ